MDQCAADTLNNTRCRNLCIKDKVYCHCHEDMKKEIYGKYKDSCKKLWFYKCTKEKLAKLSREQIKTLLKDMNTCSRLRCTFARKCCDNSIDKGHLYAIEKIERKLCKCYEILYEMYPDEYPKKNTGLCKHF